MSICTILFLTLIHGENDSLIPMKIDGSNTVQFNQEHPYQSLNTNGIIFGNPISNFPFDVLGESTYLFKDDIHTNPYLKKDSLLHIQLSTQFTTEAGEMMLNEFEGYDRKRRNNYSHVATSVEFPKTPLNLYFAIRNSNLYSERYDAIWNSFYHKNDENLDSLTFAFEPLANELYAGYSLRGPIATTSLKTKSYRQFGLSPYYFNVVYRTGYTLYPSLNFNLRKSRVDVDFLFNYHKNYYNYKNNTYTEYADEGWDITWHRQLTKSITGTLGHHKNSSLTPSTHASAKLNGTIEKILQWSLSGKVFGNLRPAGTVNISYMQIPMFTLNLNTSWDYNAAGRRYTFYHSDKPVDYIPLEYESFKIHSSIVYNDTIFFPATATVWLDYYDKPLWETVESIDGRVIVRQDTIDNAAKLTFGGKGAYRIKWRKLSLDLWGNLTISPKNKKIRYSMPRNFGADLAYGSPDNDSIYAALYFENKDGSVLRYRNENNKEFREYTSPAHTDISLFLKMPFRPPFIKNRMRTDIYMKAGPIRIGEEQRIKEHPRGSLIGPSISIGLNGYFN